MLLRRFISHCSLKKRYTFQQKKTITSVVSLKKVLHQGKVLQNLFLRKKTLNLIKILCITKEKVYKDIFFVCKIKLTVCNQTLFFTGNT